VEQALLEQIKEQILPLLTEQDVELVDLMINRGRARSILRLLVDKSEGITLDECARLNQEIGQLIERENIIQEGYVLEVSSPGLDRPLKSMRDFQRSLGKLVKFVLHQSIKGQNVWVGFVDEVDQENVLIRTENNEKLRIARKDLARAKLEVRS
jgi:ribosome maturation factor RimP